MASRPGGRQEKKNPAKQYRINEQIRVGEVRIVGDDVQPRVVSIREALTIAKDMEVDLVEISPTADPPVCRLVDYSKFLYQIKKKQKELKAKQVKTEVKEIRLGSQIGEADYNFKLKHAEGFLSEGNKVKVTVTFRGRSFIFKDQGELLLLKFANALEDVGKVENMPTMEGRRMTITLAPKKATTPRKSAPKPQPAKAAPKDEAPAKDETIDTDQQPQRPTQLGELLSQQLQKLNNENNEE